jgi:hypothetical protein
MNSVVTRQQSRTESNPKRFEFGYEKKSKNSRSVQAARADFLSIILNERPDVVFDLCASAYQPFSDLLKNIEGEIEAVSEANPRLRVDRGNQNCGEIERDVFKIPALLNSSPKQ